MNRILALLLALPIMAICSVGSVYAAEEARGGKPQAPPPAPVSVATVTSGRAEPMSWFVGSVYFAKSSRIASEVEGLAGWVGIEEGQRVKAGQAIMRLESDLLDTSIEAARGQLGQAEAQMEKARRDYERVEALYKKDSISETLYDERRFRVQELEGQVQAMRASLSTLELKRAKKEILAPFDAIVVEKTVDPGEWVPPGGVIAILAEELALDIVLDVPSGILGYLRKGATYEISVGGRSVKGKFLSLVPKGDEATRSFSVKLRVTNPGGMFEGMEARALLPTGPKTDGLLVPRDAVISKFGRDVVFIVRDGVGVMIPVRVSGYEGAMAAVEGQGLAVGLQVVVKGQERLREGQPVKPVK